MSQTRVITADLHVHTCLSPCATLDMTPQKIVEQARLTKLGLIAITDHNSAENIGAVIKAAEEIELVVIPGMEITTAEEAHVLGLFGSLDDALSMQELVYEHLTPGENDEELFGLQVIANELDEVEGMCDRLLIGATDLDLNRVVAGITERGGIAVAAHIDRESFSLLSQLGFIPPDVELAAVGISRRHTLSQARSMWPEYKGYTFLSTSDAHDLHQLGSNPAKLRIEKPDFENLKLALAGQSGRQVIEGDE
jgi:predicted metal-dependent phosphoesterase TrpH